MFWIYAYFGSLECGLGRFLVSAGACSCLSDSVSDDLLGDGYGEPRGRGILGVADVAAGLIGR